MFCFLGTWVRQWKRRQKSLPASEVEPHMFQPEHDFDYLYIIIGANVDAETETKGDKINNYFPFLILS